MTSEIDPDLLVAYRAAAREEPAELLDAKVLAAARRVRSKPLVMWARVAAAALMFSVVGLSARQPQTLPAPDDPRYFGFYAGVVQGQPSPSALIRPDPVADALLQAGRASPR